MTDILAKRPFFRALPRYSLERAKASVAPKPTQHIPRRVIAAAMLLCTLSVAAVSYLVLMPQSLRLDESQSIWQSSHSLPSGVLHTVAIDVHVPLYHLLLHVWMFYFGNGIATVRLLSLVFFVITIPVTYLMGRQVLSQRWALFMMALFGFSPFLLWYGSEARMYALLLFVATLNQLFFVRLLRGKSGWLGFTVTMIIGVYCHYFFMFNLLAEALFLLFNRRHFRRGALLRFGAVGALSLAALAPWLYYVYSLGSASTTRPHLPIPSTVDFFNVYSQFLFGFQSNWINTIFLSSWPVAMLIGMLAVRRSRGIPKELQFFATMGTVPIALAYAVSVMVTPFFLSRYMVVSVAPLLIVIVWVMSHYRGWLLRSAMVALLALLLVTNSMQVASSATPVKEDYQAAARDIAAQAKPQDVVVLSAPFTLYPFTYYYHGQAQVRTLPIWESSKPGAIPAFDPSKLEAEAKQLHDSHRYVFLLLSQDQGYQEAIDQYYLMHFKRIDERRYASDVTLYIYQVGYYTVPPLERTPAEFPVQ